MRKLILHVGCHKTGTSSIQKNLQLNEEYLLANGWELLSPKRFLRNFHQTGNANSYIDISGYKEKLSVSISQKMYSDLSKSKNDFIISAEELSWLFSEDQLRTLYDKLSRIFSDIKVVMYLRRQDKQLISHFQQGFRFYESSAAKFFGREPLPIPTYKSYFDLYFNYENKINFWSNFFGEENLLVRWFDSSTLIEGDATKDFCYITGIKLPQENFISCNEGLCKDEILIKNVLFEEFRDNYYLIEKLKLNVNSLSTGVKFTPSKNDALQFYNKYHQSNIRLISKVFSDKNYRDKVLKSLSSFDSYPVSTDTFEIEELSGLYRANIISAYHKVKYLVLYYSLKSKLRILAQIIFK